MNTILKFNMEDYKQYNTSMKFNRPNAKLQVIVTAPKVYTISVLNKKQINHKSKSIKGFIPFSPQKLKNNPQEDDKSNKNNNKIIKASQLCTNYIRSPKFLQRESHIEQKQRKSSSYVSHNLSAKNLRNTGIISTFPRRTISKTENENEKEKETLKYSTQVKGPQIFSELNYSIKIHDKQKIKKNKQTPSFIKNKQSHSFNKSDIQKIKDLDLKKCQSLVRHKKLEALFLMRTYSKQVLLKDPILYEQFRQYIKSTSVTHRLIVKFIGYSTDEQNIYFFQQYLFGHNLQYLIDHAKEQFNQGELGLKIYQLLIILTYLQQNKQFYEPVKGDNITLSMNICKLKRSALCHKRYDMFYHIWCLGKLTFQLITGEQLIPSQTFNKIESITQIFNSTQIAKCIQIGFKALQSYKISRYLIQFIIACLWTVQNKTITYETLLNFQFIKIYQEDDIWQDKIKQC